MKRTLIILSLLISIQLYSADTKNLEVEYQGQLFNVTVENTTSVSQLIDQIIELINDLMPNNVTGVFLENNGRRYYGTTYEKVVDIPNLCDDPKPKISVIIELYQNLNVSTLTKPNILTVKMDKDDLIISIKNRIIENLRKLGLTVGPPLDPRCHTDFLHFIFNGSELSDRTRVRHVDGLWENPNVTITIEPYIP